MLVALDGHTRELPLQHLDDHLTVDDLLRWNERLRQNVPMLAIVGRDLVGNLLQLIDGEALSGLPGARSVQKRLRCGDANVVFAMLYRALELECLDYNSRAFFEARRAMS